MSNHQSVKPPPPLDHASILARCWYGSGYGHGKHIILIIQLSLGKRKRIKFWGLFVVIIPTHAAGIIEKAKLCP